MIANLMMYARPELLDAHDRYWNLIRTHLERAGIESPETLSQDAEEFFIWKHPKLVLSQTCGMPYRKWLHDKVALVGTPDYGLEGCPPGFYRSAFVIRSDDPRTELIEFRDSIFGYNQNVSQSGYAAPYWHAKPLGFWFENRLHTGGHFASAQAVSEGHADIASLDAKSWSNIEKFEPLASNLSVLEWSKPTPGLPLITAASNDAKEIFEAVQNAISDLKDEDRSALGLRGIVQISKQDYLSVPNPPE